MTCLCALLNGSVASGSTDGTVILWSLTTGAPQAVLQGHTRGVRCLAVYDWDRLLSGSDDCTVRCALFLISDSDCGAWERTLVPFFRDVHPFSTLLTSGWTSAQVLEYCEPATGLGAAFTEVDCRVRCASFFCPSPAACGACGRGCAWASCATPTASRRPTASTTGASSPARSTRRCDVRKPKTNRQRQKNAL